MGTSVSSSTELRIFEFTLVFLVLLFELRTMFELTFLSLDSSFNTFELRIIFELTFLFLDSSFNTFELRIIFELTLLFLDSSFFTLLITLSGGIGWTKVGKPNNGASRRLRLASLISGLISLR
jgi:hypothetical protein